MSHFPELKIKIKSLAAEATIIRREELKLLVHARSCYQYEGDCGNLEPMAQAYDKFNSLRHHRIEDVRKECRAALLAYGFLRGRQYNQIEASCHEPPRWEVVKRLIKRYGDGDIRELAQRWAGWIDASEIREEFRPDPSF